MTTNSTNIKIDPNKIAQLLNISTRQLDSDTLSALRNARQNALQRQKAHSPAFALTTNFGIFYKLTPRSLQQWAVAVLLIAMFSVGTSYWNNTLEEQTTDLDVAILTDDLPIEVFAD